MIVVDTVAGQYPVVGLAACSGLGCLDYYTLLQTEHTHSSPFKFNTPTNIWHYHFNYWT